MIKRISLSLLFAFFIVLYLLPLAMRPLFIPDETRYAEIPREMVKSGDWVVPRINGLRYFEKPVMGYWLTAASITAFGENNFSVRLATALSTGLVAVLIFFLCSNCLGRQSSLPGLAAPGHRRLLRRDRQVLLEVPTRSGWQAPVRCQRAHPVSRAPPRLAQCPIHPHGS